jgi:DNA-binding GntR family transcriptional regulator
MFGYEVKQIIHTIPSFNLHNKYEHFHYNNSLTVFFVSHSSIIRLSFDHELQSLRGEGPMTSKTRSGRLTQPITNTEDINAIRTLLRDRPRDLLFFELAIQTGRPARRLLSLKVKDLDVQPSPPEGSGNVGGLIMSRSLQRLLLNHVKAASLAEADYIFRSRKGGGPLSLVSLSRLVKGWFQAAGLSGFSGILSLRRTWEYHHGSSGPNESPRLGRQSTPIFRPLEVTTRKAAVYRELQKAIVSGRVSPGQRLVIEEIARQMAVSAMPVREALARLEAGGFVHADKRQGYVVNELSEASLKEIRELRLLLEGKAAEQAAVRRSEKTLEKLADCEARFRQARLSHDADALLRTNREFHHTIYDAAEMPILKAIIDRLWDRVSPYYHILFRQMEKPDPTAGIRYHHLIVEGMEKGDPVEVCRWLKADLTDSTEFVLELFRLHRLDSQV